MLELYCIHVECAPIEEPAFFEQDDNLEPGDCFVYPHMVIPLFATFITSEA